MWMNACCDLLSALPSLSVEIPQVAWSASASRAMKTRMENALVRVSQILIDNLFQHFKYYFSLRHKLTDPQNL